MKRQIKTILGLLLFGIFLVSCEEKDPKVASQKAMTKALELLDKGDLDGYYQCLDFGQELDSLTQAQVAKMWVMHQEIVAKSKGKTLGRDIVKVELMGDSVAEIYLKTKFESGIEEVSSHKMVCRDGKWRIRIRN